MLRTTLRTVLLSVLAIFPLNGRAWAQQVNFSSMNPVVLEQGDRIGGMPADFVSMKYGKDACDDGCNGGKSAGDACGSSGLYAGFEGTLLKAHNGALAIAADGFGEALLPGYDYKLSPRVWLGYKGPEGLEFRVTYWGYDQSARNDFVELGLEAATFDFEVAQEGSFCNWDVEVSGGIRWARMEDAATLLDIADDPIVLGRDFEGTGLTAAMAVRRQLGQSGFAVIGSTRASLLYGESTAFVAGDFSGMVGGNVPVSQIAIVANDHVAQIYEIRVGGEWSRELDCGARLFTSVAYEAQVWELAPFALGLLDSNVGFVGPAFAIGIDR